MNERGMYGLPLEVKFCKLCTISNQRMASVVESKSRASDPKPTIAFDDDGVCSACRYAEVKKTRIDWKEREEMLRKVCDQYRSKTGAHDVLVSGSGGKDSYYVSTLLKEKFGMNPLTVTWAPQMRTEIGQRNFDSWNRHCDNIQVTPGGNAHRKLTRLAFLNLLHSFQPFITGQRNVTPRVSVMTGIPFIMYGDSPGEYGGDIAETARPEMPSRFYEDDGELVLGGVPEDELIREHGFTSGDLDVYRRTSPDRLRAVGTTVHYASYYVKYDPQEAYYWAAERGFKANEQRTEQSYSKYSSIDCKLDITLHYWTTYLKTGLGRASYDTAQEIRNEKIDREEGVMLVKKFDHEQPRKFLREVLEYLDIDEETYTRRCDEGRSPHLWTKEGDEWKLMHAVWHAV